MGNVTSAEGMTSSYCARVDKFRSWAIRPQHTICKVTGEDGEEWIIGLSKELPNYVKLYNDFLVPGKVSYFTGRPEAGASFFEILNIGPPPIVRSQHVWMIRDFLNIEQEQASLAPYREVLFEGGGPVTTLTGSADPQRYRHRYILPKEECAHLEVGRNYQIAHQVHMCPFIYLITDISLGHHECHANK